MAQTKNKSNWMVAKEAIVVVVGAKPPVYAEIEVKDDRTGEMKKRIESTVVVEEGEHGVGYSFRAYQKVHKSHPAVKANPGAFIPLEELDEDLEELVAP